MKRKVHRAFVEELPCSLGLVACTLVRAGCHATGESSYYAHGGGVGSFPGDQPEERAARYLNDACPDAEHVL